MPKWTSVCALLVLVAAACSNSSDSNPAPAITDASLARSPGNTISAVLTVKTEDPAAVSVSVKGPGGGFDIPEDAAKATHSIPVVGMRADADYTVTVRAGKATKTLEWHTGSLPADLPPVSLATVDAARMAPGVTVFNAMPWAAVPEGAPAPDAGYVLAVDEDGEVVWYAKVPLQILDVDMTRRGTFLVTAGDTVIQEIDLLGNVVREWGSRIATGDPGEDLSGRLLHSDATEPIDVDSTHHEVTELANGGIITLSTEVIELDPADAVRLCPDAPETSVVGDIVVELSPDGDIVQQWPISAVYDPAETPGSEMCTNGPPVAPPNWFYPAAQGTRDWTHANAVTLDDANNTLIVSSRHLDQVIGLRYHDDDAGKAGELLWSLGVGGTIELDGELTNHQHAVELEDAGSLMMYDNGNLRPGTLPAGGDAPPFSRAVLYDVDLEAGTATQVWEHRDTWPDGRPVYTPFLGDVDREPNGNVLITHGGGTTADGALVGRIVEVVPGDAPDGSDDTIVFDLNVGAGTADASWTLYRSERLPSLYFAA